MGHTHEYLQRIGKVIREREKPTDEPLPERWVELIHYLNEKERRQTPARRSNREARQH